MPSQKVRESVLGKPDSDEKVDLANLDRADPQSQQLDTTHPIEGDIMPGASQVVDSMIDQLARWAEEDAGASEDALAQIVASAWQAEDTDSLLSGSNAIHARDVLGRTIWATRMTVVPSEIEGDDNCPFYAVIHGHIAPGAQPVVVTCGGWRVVAELGNIRKRGDFPRNIAIVNARKRAVNGKMPLKLAFPA